MTDKPKYDRGYEAAVDEFARVIGRAPETPSTRVVRRPAPTLEDVDAELQPKGLQVLTLTEPAWMGPWASVARGGRFRQIVIPLDGKATLADARIWQHHETRWDFECGERGKLYVRDSGHPTPEAAQAACEAAIVAAWRNR